MVKHKKDVSYKLTRMYPLNQHVTCILPSMQVESRRLYHIVEAVIFSTDFFQFNLIFFNWYEVSKALQHRLNIQYITSYFNTKSRKDLNQHYIFVNMKQLNHYYSRISYQINLNRWRINASYFSQYFQLQANETQHIETVPLVYI